MQVQLILQIEDSGKFNFIGPMDNKVLCYGLLELAKEVVAKHEPQPQAPPAEVGPEAEPAPPLALVGG